MEDVLGKRPLSRWRYVSMGVRYTQEAAMETCKGSPRIEQKNRQKRNKSNETKQRPPTQAKRMTRREESSFFFWGKVDPVFRSQTRRRSQ